MNGFVSMDKLWDDEEPGDGAFWQLVEQWRNAAHVCKAFNNTAHGFWCTESKGMILNLVYVHYHPEFLNNRYQLIYCAGHILDHVLCMLILHGGHCFCFCFQKMVISLLSTHPAGPRMKIFKEDYYCLSYVQQSFGFATPCLLSPRMKIFKENHHLWYVQCFGCFTNHY